MKKLVLLLLGTLLLAQETSVFFNVEGTDAIARINSGTISGPLYGRKEFCRVNWKGTFNFISATPEATWEELRESDVLNLVEPSPMFIRPIYYAEIIYIDEIEEPVVERSEYYAAITLGEIRAELIKAWNTDSCFRAKIGILDLDTFRPARIE